MSITTEQYERIIRFLDAGMDPAEMDAFAHEMSANPEMRRQLDFEQSVRDGFSLRNITSLPVEDTVADGKPGKLTRMRKWLAIGAAVIAAVTLLTLFMQKKSAQPQKAAEPHLAVSGDSSKPVDSVRSIDFAALFKTHFKKDGIPEQAPLFLADALTDYVSGRYKTLEKLDLNNLPQTRGADDEENILKWGHYFKGLAFLEDSHLTEAKSNLQWVLDHSSDKALRDKAKWYLALTAVKEGDKATASALCKSMIDHTENHSLHTQATQLLGELKQ